MNKYQKTVLLVVVACLTPICIAMLAMLKIILKFLGG